MNPDRLLFGLLRVAIIGGGIIALSAIVLHSVG